MLFFQHRLQENKNNDKIKSLINTGAALKKENDWLVINVNIQHVIGWAALSHLANSLL